METDQNIQHSEATPAPDTTSQSTASTPSAEPQQGTRSGAAWAWTAIIVAFLAWVLLMASNGYIALTAGIVATVLSIVALCRSHGAMHRLSVTALIASLVLVVVLAAFIIVIKVGLG